MPVRVIEKPVWFDVAVRLHDKGAKGEENGYI
jgi:hypothetical protein